MSGVRGSVLALVALLGAAGAIMAAPGLGATTANVTVGIGYQPAGASPFFRGIVKSSRASCAAGRKVRVYRQRNGHGHQLLFGSTRSDSGGNWRIPLHAQMKTGGYYAVVKAKPGCAKAFSDPIAIR